MTVFTDKELEYLRSQRLARLATADATGTPHVVPVGFRLSDEANAIEVGGHNFAKSKKYRDLKANPEGRHRHRDTGHTQLPLCEADGRLESAVGTVNAKDLLR
jgi:predicted pyridoxine 5'-phosphate oxidase superfamily flavin-nucleotide-binding protein